MTFFIQLSKVSKSYHPYEINKISGYGKKKGYGHKKVICCHKKKDDDDIAEALVAVAVAMPLAMALGVAKKRRKRSIPYNTNAEIVPFLDQFTFSLSGTVLIISPEC